MSEFIRRAERYPEQAPEQNRNGTPERRNGTLGTPIYVVPVLFRVRPENLFRSVPRSGLS